MSRLFREGRLLPQLFGLAQGFAESFYTSSTGRLAILQLLSSQERKKMVEELLKRNKQNLNVRPSGARCIYFNSWCKHCKRCLVLGVYYGCYDLPVFTVVKWTSGVNSPTWYANIL